jgi:Flp pilus assembly protein TadG
MHWKNINSERGQAIVYLVLGLVVFLGFVALAIDGGMALADRRHEQNAADAASLAGGGKAALDMDSSKITSGNWSCAKLSANAILNHAEVAAYNRAKDNNFTLTYPRGTSLHNYASATCSDSGKYMDVSVEISATTQANFLQLVFPKALHNEVEAVTRVYPRGPLAFGNAIVALNGDTCSGSQNGVMFKGNGDSIINGGGVFSNGCLEGAGRPEITVNGAGYNWGAQYISGNAAWTPTPPTLPTSSRISAEDYYIKEPDCNGHWVTNTDINRKGVEIGPALYCFHGDFSTQANDVIVGHGVTFYVEGKITLNGNDKTVLEAPPQGAKIGIPGVVFYVPPKVGVACPDKTKEVIINGTSGLIFTGVVIAPCSNITMNGTTGIVTYNNQVIGYNVFITGNAEVDINYDENKMSVIPPKLDLYR